MNSILRIYAQCLITSPFENCLTLKQVQYKDLLVEEEETHRDEDGYLKLAKAEYQLPIIHRETTFGILGMLISSRFEGWSSLWKGHIAYFFTKLSTSLIQPLICECLEYLASRDDFVIPMALSHAVAIRFVCLLASHTIAGLILSPLELIQTRFVVQSQGKRKYKSVFRGLLTIQREEYQGGLGMWFSSKLFLPAMLKHSLQPIFDNSTPIITDRVFRSRKASSLAIVSLEFFIGTLELLVMIPIDTVRKRLQCQAVRKTPVEASEFNTVVQLSPIPYTSSLDCAWRIVNQESSGIAGLYRGFKVRIWLNVVVAGLQLLLARLEESTAVIS